MKLKIIEQILGSYYRSSNEYLFFCKKCKHRKRKFSVNIAKNAFKCWVCNFTGSLDALVRQFGNLEQYRQWKEVTNTVDHSSTSSNLREMFLPKSKEEKKEIQIELELPKEFVSLVGNDSLSAGAARKYLRNRGVDMKDIVAWKMGYCIGGDYGNRIVIPSFDFEARLNYFVARSYVEDFRAYMNPQVSKDVIFNELLIDFEQPVVLVEGVFDAVKAGENAIPLLGSVLSTESRLFQMLMRHKPLVYVSLDPDAREKENRLIKSLLNFGLDVAKVDIEGFKDPGAMSKQVFAGRKDCAKLISSNMVFRDVISQKLEVSD